MRLTTEQAKNLFPDLKLGPTLKRKAKIPAAASQAEELFFRQCATRKLPTPTREHLFAMKLGRMWRFDFCFDDYRYAVEIEGLVCKYIGGIPYAIGRHATFTGFQGDCEKYSKANLLGWHVDRWNQALVKNGTAIDAAEEFLKSRGWRRP